MASSSEEEEEEVENDEMDSLFEGMVLFTPCQIAAEADGDGDGDERKRDNLGQQQQISSSVSQPLDENLFSDLTLTTPVQSETLAGVGVHAQSDPSSPRPIYTSTNNRTTTTSRKEVVLSRQISSSSSSSTRKKKRAGLRIGYGRDAHAQVPPDDHSSSSSYSNESQQQQQLPTSSYHRLPPLPSSSSLSSSVAEIEFNGTTTALQVDIDKGAEQDASSQLILDSSPRVTTSSHGIDYSHASTIAIGVNNNGISHSVPDAEPADDIREQQEEDDDDDKSTSPTESRFEQIKAQISKKLKHARQAVTSVSVSRKDAIRRRRKAAENLISSSTKYREMEKALEEACEAEDFEAAHRVSECLASAETDKEVLANALRDAEAECDAVDSRMQEVLECQIAAEDDCASLLQSFALDAANNADLALKNVEEISSKEMDKWLLSTEALEVKKMELEIESHVVNEARLVLNNSIEHSVNDDRREREILCKKRENLTEELQKLLALVKHKEAEIAENDSCIEKVEKRIVEVVSSFQEVQSSINTKYNNLQFDLSQMELRSEALSRKKKENDAFLSQEEGRGAKIRELAKISADEANTFQEVVGLRKSLVQFNLKSREDKMRLVKTAEKLSEDVQMLKQEISAARTSLQELSSTKSTIQQEVESFKQRLSFIDKRTPELETDKKVAATARNFKEAARIATEAKTLYVEKEGVHKKMEGALSEFGKLDYEILDTVNCLQEIEVQLSFKERELAMTRFQMLLLIAGAATAERSAALELGDLQEADILLGEAEAASSEAKKLMPIYNIKDQEFENLPKHYISMELVSHLGVKQLAELAVSTGISSL